MSRLKLSCAGNGSSPIAALPPNIRPNNNIRTKKIAATNLVWSFVLDSVIPIDPNVSTTPASSRAADTEPAVEPNYLQSLMDGSSRVSWSLSRLMPAQGGQRRISVILQGCASRARSSRRITLDGRASSIQDSIPRPLAPGGLHANQLPGIKSPETRQSEDVNQHDHWAWHQSRFIQ